MPRMPSVRMMEFMASDNAQRIQVNVVVVVIVLVTITVTVLITTTVMLLFIVILLRGKAIDEIRVTLVLLETVGPHSF